MRGVYCRWWLVSISISFSIIFRRNYVRLIIRKDFGSACGLYEYYSTLWGCTVVVTISTPLFTIRAGNISSLPGVLSGLIFSLAHSTFFERTLCILADVADLFTESPPL